MLLLLPLLFAGSAPTLPRQRATPAPHATADRLAQLSDRYLAQIDREDPIVAVTAAGRAARQRRDNHLLSNLGMLDVRHLNDDERVDAIMLGDALRYDLWKLDIAKDWRWDVQQYEDLIRDALSHQPQADAPAPRDRLLGAAARFRRIPAFLASIRASIDPARVPASHARLVAEQNRHVLDGLFEPLLDHIGELPPQEETAVRRAIALVQAAMVTHQRWLDQVLVPRAHGSFRLGAALYDAKVRFELGSALARPAIAAKAHLAADAIRARMYGIATRLLAGQAGAPATPPEPSSEQMDAAIRAALAQMEDRRPTRDGFITAIRKTLQDTTAFVKARDLVGVPDAAVAIETMPASMQGIVPAFYENDGARSIYAVSPIPQAWSDARADDYLRAHNDYYLENLTIHEAMPGHYLQSAHLRANASPLRRALGSREFAEGWAVYAQQMMVDEGYLADDPRFELAELQWRLGSVCNALLDIGVHTGGMTRQEGIDLLTRVGFQRPAEAASKWERATLTSTQLLTYFVGYSEHTALRDEVRRRDGAAFSLRRYNDRVLSYGMPPVRLVRALMLGEPAR